MTSHEQDEETWIPILGLLINYEFSEKKGPSVLSKQAQISGDHPILRAPAINQYQTTKHNPKRP